jgi:acyl carrier protein
MTTRTTILSQIQQVAAEQKKTLAPLTDDLSLLDSGLDSLCFAILVARLEDVLGVDPFTADDGARFPNTVGELVAFYEHAAA